MAFTTMELHPISNCDLYHHYMELKTKDLSRVKPCFESVPPKFHFEIAGLASAVKWRKIQNVVGEERFQSRLLAC